MSLADFGVVISHAVMAFGKQRDRTDMPALEHFLELLGVEIIADAGDFFRSVKVEMNLAESQEEYSLKVVATQLYTLLPGIKSALPEYSRRQLFGFGITAQNLVADGVIFQFFERVLQRLIVAMRLHIGEKAVFPGFLSRRPRLNH